FATQFFYRLRNASQTSGFAVSWLEDRLQKSGMDAEEAMMAEHNRLASGNVTTGNIIKSLREIDDTEWSVWFEDISHVDRIFREQSDYESLDFGSRNSYRNRIEKLARRSHLSETDVVQKAIELSQQAAASGPDAGEANIGAFLVGRRRRQLEAAVGYDAPLLQRAVRAFRRLNWLAIAGPVALLTLVAMAVVGWFLANAGLSVPVVILLLLMFALPASEGATGLFNTLVTYMVKPARLVGYEFKDGIPEDARTLLVVPCMITSRDSVDELVRNLEVHYLANPRGEIYFALLSD